ncbi:unnamed protein product, partial [Nesidiocoris tenuis]
MEVFGVIYVPLVYIRISIDCSMSQSTVCRVTDFEKNSSRLGGNELTTGKQLDRKIPFSPFSFRWSIMWEIFKYIVLNKCEILALSTQ